jgi:hypothetical protein
MLTHRVDAGEAALQTLAFGAQRLAKAGEELHLN